MRKYTLLLVPFMCMTFSVEALYSPATLEASLGARGYESGARIQDACKPTFADGCSCPLRNGAGNSFLTASEKSKPTYHQRCMQKTCYCEMVGSQDGKERNTTHVNANPMLGPQGGQAHSGVETDNHKDQQYPVADSRNEYPVADKTKADERLQRFVKGPRGYIDKVVQSADVSIVAKGSQTAGVYDNGYAYFTFPLPSPEEQKKEIARIQQLLAIFSEGYIPLETAFALTDQASTRKISLLEELESSISELRFNNKFSPSANDKSMFDLAKDNEEAEEYHAKQQMAELTLRDDDAILKMYEYEMAKTKEMADAPTVTAQNDHWYEFLNFTMR